jgi:hypothetical protein
MSRRLPAVLVGALTVFALIAGALAPSVAASGRPSVTLDVTVDGTTATVVAEINRGPQQIDSCMYVLDDSAAATCGSATETAKKAARYTFTATDLAVGSHVVTVTIDLNGNASASDAFPFEVANTETDTDGDGIPDATDNCPTVANADQLDQYGSASGDACEDIDGDGTLDVNEADICVSVDGTDVLSHGNTTCSSDPSPDGGPNIAVANGVGAVAQALGGHDNTATAIGSDSSAAAYAGSNNTALADGDGAIAAAFGGDHNSATASGDGTFAVANSPTGCTVTNGTCP